MRTWSLSMREQQHNIEKEEFVKPLWNDLQFIESQVNCIRSDIEYLKRLLQNFEFELSLYKGELRCVQ